jgi:hypothetical protein
VLNATSIHHIIVKKLEIRCMELEAVPNYQGLGSVKTNSCDNQLNQMFVLLGIPVSSSKLMSDSESETNIVLCFILLLYQLQVKVSSQTNS